MNSSSSARRAVPLSLAALLSVSLAAAALLFGAAPAASAASDPGGEDDVTWAVRTASNELGSARTNFTYTIDPGGTLDDAIVVTNHGDDTIDLKLYAADGHTSEQGDLSLVLSGEQSTGIGAWLAPGRADLTLEPGQEATVPFTVTVPVEATPGDYAGGFVTSLTVPDSDAQVNVDRRLAMRVNLRVGGALAPALAIEDPSVTWSGGANPLAIGDATLTYTLHNTGNAAVSAVPSGRVAGPFGWFGVDAPEADEVPRLLPGESWTQTVTVPGVIGAVALSGAVSVTPLVVDASGSTSPIPDVTADVGGWAVPWVTLALLVLIVAAVIVIVRLARRRRRAARQEASAAVDAAVEKALEEERARVAGAARV